VSDEVSERIEEQREGQGDGKESRSAAIKRIIRAGLEAEEREDGVYLTRSAAIVMVGWFGIIAAFADADAFIGYLGTALLVAGIIIGVADRRGWI